MRHSAMFVVLLVSMVFGLGKSQRNSAAGYPLYMMQLYRTFTKSDFVTERETTAPLSNCVLNLIAKGCHHVGDSWTITFDLSSVPTHEQIQRAELRIRLPAFANSQNASLDLYHSKTLPNCTQHSQSCIVKPILWGTLKTLHTDSKSSWNVFNVTTLLSNWQNHDGGLSWDGSREFDEASGSGDGGSLVDHLTGRKDHRKVSCMITNKVTLLIFSRLSVPTVGQQTYSLIHTVENSKYVGRPQRERQGRRLKRNRLEDTVNQKLHMSDTALPVPEERVPVPQCRRVDMWVDFDHIGWDTWIIHPKRYNAYRCEGACPIPLDESFSPTNHAYMQSLVLLHHPDKVSCPSCVPTRLSPLSMLYYENDDLTLRHHDDMIVEECGCH